MSDQPKYGKTVLELQLDAAATPGRVERAARMFDDLVKAAGEQLPPDSLTLVVDNYSMRVGVRPQNEEGKRLLDRITSVLKDPLKALRETPEVRELAKIVSDYGKDAKEDKARIKRWRAHRPFVEFDNVYIKMLSGAVESDPNPEDSIKGTTVVYSPIYRVGRTSEGKKNQARVMLDGKPHDIEIDDAAKADFFDAAKTGRTVMISLETEWIRGSDGSRKPRVKGTRAIAVQACDEDSSGKSILDAISDLPPLDPEQLASIIDRLEE